MAAAATPATAAATFRFFVARRLLPTFAVTFDASDFALPPARFAAFFARLADFAMLATACSDLWGGSRNIPGPISRRFSAPSLVP